MESNNLKSKRFRKASGLPPLCSRCTGTGEEPGAPIDLTDGEALCSKCGGTGVNTARPWPRPEDIKPWEEIERLQLALEKIANSVAFVLMSSKVPAKLRPGLQSIEDEARTALASTTK